MGKRSSSLIEETVTELEDGRTMYYGRKAGVLRITIKGTYTPTVKRKTTYEYNEYAEKLDKTVHHSIYRAIEKEFGDRLIVDSSLTVQGICFGKNKNYQYTIYVYPDNHNDEQTTEHIVSIAQEQLEKEMKEFGFATTKQRQKPRGRKSKKN